MAFMFQCSGCKQLATALGQRFIYSPRASIDASYCPVLKDGQVVHVCAVNSTWRVDTLGLQDAIPYPTDSELMVGTAGLATWWLRAFAGSAHLMSCYALTWYPSGSLLTE